MRCVRPGPSKVEWVGVVGNRLIHIHKSPTPQYSAWVLIPPRWETNSEGKPVKMGLLGGFIYSNAKTVTIENQFCFPYFQFANIYILALLFACNATHEDEDEANRMFQPSGYESAWNGCHRRVLIVNSGCSCSPRMKITKHANWLNLLCKGIPANSLEFIKEIPTTRRWDRSQCPY